jgi:imidazolonepropionase-like amidohydrolase
MGSDAFRVLKHGDNAIELEWMVKAGMSEMEALVSATKISAEALGIEHRIGSVEEEKLADLIVVDPNPLMDISVLQNRANIKMIMKNGEIIHSAN